MRANLDLIRPHLRSRLDHWYRIAIAIEALKLIKPSAWIESFTKVNLHPRFRVSFDMWWKKRDGKLSDGKFFTKNRTSLFDAMPAVWKKLSVENRHAVVALIDGFHASNEFEEVPILRKVIFCSLSSIHLYLFAMTVVRRQLVRNHCKRRMVVPELHWKRTCPTCLIRFHSQNSVRISTRSTVYVPGDPVNS
jgi:hypothetical protein